MEAYGLTRLPGAKVLPPEPAAERGRSGASTRAEYLAVLRAASAGEPRARTPTGYGLGPRRQPDLPGVCGRPRASRAAARSSRPSSSRAARPTRAFHFAGGLHHAMPARASGFCYVNDAVLAILALRRARPARRLRRHRRASRRRRAVAFYDDPDVLTISTHERGDRLFPGTGFVEELGEGAGARLLGQPAAQALHRRRRVPRRRSRRSSRRSSRAFKPDVVVAQLGIDAHRTDPLTHLALSVEGFAEAVRRIVGLAPRLVALGGGGYDLSNVARAWTAAWAIMNGVTLPPELPPGFVVDAAPYLHGRRTLWDPPAVLPVEAVRPAREFAERQIAELRRRVFPLLGVPPAGA